MGLHGAKKIKLTSWLGENVGFVHIPPQFNSININILFFFEVYCFQVNFKSK